MRIRNPFFPAIPNTWTQPQTFNAEVTHNNHIRLIGNQTAYWSGTAGGNGIYSFKGPDDFSGYGNLIFDDGINVVQQTNMGLPAPNPSYAGVIFRYDLRSNNPSGLPTLSATGQWYIIAVPSGAPSASAQPRPVIGVDSAGNFGTEYVQLGRKPSSISPTIASGTVYQNTTYAYQTLVIPVYATTAGTAGSASIALGTASTPAAWGTQYVSGGTSSTACELITLRVPPQWYYSVTVSGATIGTVNGVQE